MPLAANDPKDRVEQLVILTERLSGLMEKETELLETRRPNEIADFQDERSKLSTIYAQEMELIKRNKSLVAGVEPELMDQLKNITQSFQGVLEEHGRILNRIQTVTEGMVKAVAEDVDAKNNQQIGYGQDGNMQKPGTNRPTSIAVHEII